MALFQEHRGNYAAALETWEGIQTTESHKRTIQILKKSGGSKEWIKQYGKAVFLEDPDIGLTLFQNERSEHLNSDQPFGGEFQESYDSVSMTTDEIIEFLDQIEESIRNKYNVHEGR